MMLLAAVHIAFARKIWAIHITCTPSSANDPLRKTKAVCISLAHHLVNLSFAGSVLVHGQNMVKGQVAFMPVTAMRQRSRRECMMRQRNEERWPRTL